MPFFRYYYTVFDRSASRKTMNFAQAGESCEPAPFHGEKVFAQLDASQRKPLSMAEKGILTPKWAAEAHSDFAL